MRLLVIGYAILYSMSAVAGEERPQSAPSAVCVPANACVHRMAEVAQLQASDCCIIRNGTNGWDPSDGVTREQCIRTNKQAGGGVKDWYHYPNEKCSAVAARCGPNPC
jgi:hypothetical protein